MSREPRSRGALALLPAVDVLGRQAVHLVRGRAESADVVGDPVDVARRWQAAGAPWVHLVDLDAAFGGTGQPELLAEVVRSLDVDVEVSGGIRDAAGLERALSTGARRVVLSTAALADRGWCSAALAQWPDRIAVGLDVRAGELVARGTGWRGGPFADALDWLDAAGCRCYVVTDVDRDGALAGPDLDLLRTVCGRTDADVVASGGVSTLDDLRALVALGRLGVSGVIVGAALHTGAFSVREALAVVSGSTPTG